MSPVKTKKDLPFQLEAILVSHEGLLPRMRKNRRPSVQWIIEHYLIDENVSPGHEHHSFTGLSAHIIATHLTLQGQAYTLRSVPGQGYFIRRVV